MFVAENPCQSIMEYLKWDSPENIINKIKGFNHDKFVKRSSEKSKYITLVVSDTDSISSKNSEYFAQVHRS